MARTRTRTAAGSLAGMAAGMLLAALAVLALAGPVAAATFPRVVAPGATRQAEPCLSVEPCSLQWALTRSAAGEAVQMIGGTYAFTGEGGAPLQVPAGVTLERFPGPGARALIEQSVPFASCSPCATVQLQPKAVLREVDVTQAAAPQAGEDAVLASLSAIVERSHVTGARSALAFYEAAPEESPSGSVRDSLVIAEDGTAVAAQRVSVAHLDSVTAVAHGLEGGTALFVEATKTRPATLVAVNTIAHGDAHDLIVHSEPAAEPTEVALARAEMLHSNFRGGVRGVRVGGNSQVAQLKTVNAEPLFAGPGDYREAYGSPTIDTGMPDNASGATDLGNEPRVSGAAMDIGAYEFQSIPPVLTTAPASSPTPSTVHVSGTVNSFGAPGAWYVSYGTSSLYTERSASLPLAELRAPVALATTLTGLAPTTTYHFQIVAVTPFGPTAGPDETFTTTRQPPSFGGGVFFHGVTPQDSGLRLSPPRFRAAVRGAAFTSSATGTTVSWSDSQVAITTVTVLTRRPGRNLFGICIAPPRHGSARLRPCTRWVAVASLAHVDGRGANHVRFSGRAGGRRLAPGGYRIAVRPSLLGRAGATLQASFTILAR